MKRINKNLLMKTAMKSDHKIYMHATLIIKGGRLISRGYNHGSIHSEFDAISNLPIEIHKWRGAIAINFMRKRSNGREKNSKPCSKCIDNFRAIGIKRVIYFNGQDFVEENLQ